MSGRRVVALYLDAELLCPGAEFSLLMSAEFLLLYRRRAVVPCLGTTTLLTQPPSTEKDHDEVREEARQLMMEIQAKSVEYDEGRKVSVDIQTSRTSHACEPHVLSVCEVHALQACGLHAA